VSQPQRQAGTDPLECQRPILADRHPLGKLPFGSSVSARFVNALSGASGYSEVVWRSDRERRTGTIWRPWGWAAPADGALEAMIVNLNQYRKKRRRAEAEERAKENRIRFGRGKEERSRELRERERADKEIEDKRLD
jgi:hypothetical protein